MTRPDKSQRAFQSVQQATTGAVQHRVVNRDEFGHADASDFVCILLCSCGRSFEGHGASRAATGRDAKAQYDAHR